MQLPYHSMRRHTAGFVYKPGMGEGHQVCIELHQQAMFSGKVLAWSRAHIQHQQAMFSGEV